MNKPGVRTGGQIVMVTDVEFLHRHNIHNYPSNFKPQGNNEVNMIIDQLEDSVVESPTASGVKKIYDNQTEICWYN